MTFYTLYKLYRKNNDVLTAIQLTWETCRHA